MTLVEIAPSPQATELRAQGVAELVISATPPSVAWARRWVVRQLEVLGAGDECLCIAELLASELITNAVRHVPVDGMVTIRVNPELTTVVVAVHDGSEELPSMGEPGPEDLCGRGLPLVDQLAAQWGADLDADGGKTVWFRLTR